MVVAYERKFYFYLPWLDLLSIVESNDIVDGVNSVTQFKPLVYTQEPEFVIISKIYDPKKIEARGTRTYTGDSSSDYFMVEVTLANF